MRSETDAGKVQRFMQELGRRCSGAGNVYFAGGTSAVLVGWRTATVDIDLKFDPEPAGAFAAIARLKDELDLNVELAAPDDFVPAIPGWRERSPFIATYGSIHYFHYDFQTQALSKIVRGHSQDLKDVREMLARQLVRREHIGQFAADVSAELERYPALDADVLREKVDDFLRTLGPDSDRDG
ncbi:MAG TPA: DUF6036 family nucleotidyltransferase [Polyangiaceae bacterium]|nr:DUF6036 family nucleotidyltransferase [Polyangiaceae bacterium]